MAQDARHSASASAQETDEDLRAMLGSLEAQLVSLYEEKEHAPDHGALVASVQSFEAQLHALYDEQAHAPYTLREAVSMVDSLEAQVAALLEERNDLADQLARVSTAAASAR